MSDKATLEEKPKVLETCLHGCYYVDTEKECNIEKEFCKRERECITNELLNQLEKEIKSNIASFKKANPANTNYVFAMIGKISYAGFCSVSGFFRRCSESGVLP